MCPLEEQQNSTEIPSTTENISSIIDKIEIIDNLILDNKVQMIDISLNEVDIDIDEQDREDEEVECEVKPDTSTSFVR